MELATIFLIWLVVVAIDNLSKRKKRRLPPPQNSDFDIPTLANDPNFPGEEVPIFIETPRQDEVRPKRFSAQVSRQQPPKQELRTEETNELDLNLTPATVMDAFILNEILGKPKALRR